MFSRLFHFLKGYVIIEISGADIERFLNICVRRNLGICNVERTLEGSITLYIRAKDFASLRPVAFKTKTKVRLLQKSQLYKMGRNRKKFYGFLSGFVVLVLFFFLSSGHIWVVEINGVYHSDYDKICSILEDRGVYAGAKKSGIADKKLIKQSLINGTDTISWAWLYVEGTKARVEIYEKNLPSVPLRSNEACNIVAARDGFLEQLVTTEGMSTTHDGTAVMQGDVLISGRVPVFKEYIEDERYMLVAASGIARAVCTHTLSGIYSTKQQTQIPTGRAQGFLCFEIFGKPFYLFGKENPKFENYKTTFERHELKIPFWGFSGLAIVTKKCEEVSIKKEIVPYEVALDSAKDDLEEKMAKELLKNPTLINSEVECKTINDTDFEVTLKMTVSEDIGIKQPIQEE